jgi:creatinine amidohydrolase
MKEWLLEETRYKLTKDVKFEVAVLPIGAIEPHGMHLPYGSDYLTIKIMADRSCEAAHKIGAKVILLPTIPYGEVTCQLEFPLAINLSQKTLERVVGDIVDSLEKQGIFKLILFNGHGGNDCKSIMRETNQRSRVFICTLEWWKMTEDIQKEVLDDFTGDHANEMETSVVLALFNDLVSMKDAGNGSINPTIFDAINRGWVQMTRPWHLFTKDSGYGNPLRASKEKGERIVNGVIERASGFIKELSDAVIDENFPYRLKDK